MIMITKTEEKEYRQLIEGQIHDFSKAGKNHPIYEARMGMRDSCFNLECENFKDYGGRGIFVCAQWDSSFEAFLRDMGPTWKAGLSLDRIDKNGHYNRLNCRWVTSEENEIAK
jgi:hypothetical protein